jgi:hypothetical protein
MATDNIWDPEHKYDSETSPFLIVNGTLKKFRPCRALEYLQDDSHWSGRKEIIWAGFAAWMIAPSGPIKTSNRNLRKLSAPEFIYQSMLVAAAKYLDGLFNDARAHQSHVEEYSNEILFEQLGWDEADFELFFVLGGFRALLDHSSASEFRSNLENQSVVLEHIGAIFQALTAARANEKPVSQKAIFDQVSNLFSGIEGQRRRGGGSSTLRGHWDALTLSAPFLFAIKDIGKDDIVLDFLGCRTWQGKQHQEKDFEWAGACLSRAEGIARLLNESGWGPVIWPPTDCIA